MTEKDYWNGGLAVHVLVWARDLRKENVGENCGTCAPSLRLSVSVGVPVKIIVQGIREIMWPECPCSRQQVEGWVHGKTWGSEKCVTFCRPSGIVKRAQLVEFMNPVERKDDLSFNS